MLGFDGQIMRLSLHLTTRCFAVVVMFILLALGSRVDACPLLLPFSSVTIKGNSLSVEIASTPEAQVCGLAHRKSLPEDRGMLFVYLESKSFEFWMKDTELALSIAFLNDTGRILAIQDMAPMQTDVRYRSPAHTRYALEVNRGWFARHEIKVGDVVEFKLPEQYGKRQNR